MVKTCVVKIPFPVRKSWCGRTLNLQPAFESIGVITDMRLACKKCLEAQKDAKAKKINLQRNQEIGKQRGRPAFEY
jgi:hypothetical protein